MDGMKARSNNNTTNNNQIVEDKLKPDWAGDDILSKAVDAAISNKISLRSYHETNGEENAD